MKDSVTTDSGFYPVTCERCDAVIDRKDAEFLDSPTGFLVYCTNCIEGVLVDEENLSGCDSGERYLYDHWWLEADQEFTQWLEFIDSQGERDADSPSN